MLTIPVKASKSYDVCIGKGLLSADSNYIADKLRSKSVMIVSDENVYGLYGHKLESMLDEALITHHKFVFSPGEQSKSLATYGELVEEMCKSKMTRSDVILALGGGVVGDLAGFAAATYQRGIDFLQIPTSLLAAVDSSVGGKTGVDLASGKNQVGAFCQPIHVLCDVALLDSLPEEEYENGCGEIIKYAMIADKELFENIGNKPIIEQYEDVIYKCVSIKRDFVEEDEFDTGLRMMLNFGHTFGHGIEKCSGYTIAHGRAVAIGMALITKASVAMGICEEKVYDELIDLLKQYNLPYETSYKAEDLADVIMTDKKGSGDTLTLVVPTDIGKCVLKKISKEDVTKWLVAGGVK